MKRAKITVLIVFLSITLTLGLSFSEATASDPFIRQVAVDGVKYRSGGAGIEERDLLKTMQNDYDLKVIFAMTSGAYLANIKTVVSKPGGKPIFETVTTGPWLLAKLPQGRYEITTYYHDMKKTAQVDISKGHKDIYIEWQK